MQSRQIHPLSLAKSMRLLLASLLFAAVPATTSANLLVNGNFEDQPNLGACIAGDAGYCDLTGSQIPGWQIQPGHAASVHIFNFYSGIPAGNYSINVDGSGYNQTNANLYQDVASALGQSYVLEFDWRTWNLGYNGPRPNLDVSLTDIVTNDLLYHGNFAWVDDAPVFSWNSGPWVHHETADFTGTGNPLRLRVQQNPGSGANDNSFIVDNFSIKPNEVPIPGTLLLLLSGLASLATSLRRRSG